MSSPFSSSAAVIDCETAVRRLWDYLDGELDAARFAEVEQHLATCAACTEHVEFSRAFLRAVTEHGASTAAPATDAELRQRVVARLAAEGFRRSSD
jgi:mycothiol system anti-sigma-R factor